VSELVTTAPCDLTGVTEARAGNFVFIDLIMNGVGVCRPEDIAISVLATFIGHQTDNGWIVVDVGWMSLSRDRGTARQGVGYGYGWVTDLSGRHYPDLIVAEANQEHGIVALRPGSSAALPALPIGAKVRILPNHACATAAQHDVITPTGRLSSHLDKYVVQYENQNRALFQAIDFSAERPRTSRHPSWERLKNGDPSI